MSKNKKILVSWLGTTDTRQLAAGNAGDGWGCPLVSLLSNRHFGPFDELCLFITRDRPACEDASRELAQALGCLESLCGQFETKIRQAYAEDNARIASPEKLRNFSLETLERFYPQKGSCDFYYNITSGTTLMATIQLHLSQGSACAGEALYTFPPHWLPPEAASESDNVYSAQLPGRLCALTGDESLDDDLYLGPNRKIYDQIRLKVAATDAAILIQGATGAGKSVLAKYIHRQDPKRRNRPFVSVNCAMFSPDPNSLRSELFGHVRGAYTGAHSARPGAFWQADGGILFLDEIGELPLGQQGLLLRALDEGRIAPLGSSEELAVDVRIIAATNINLLQAVDEGRFREDLYYRLAQYTPQLKSVCQYTESERECLLLKLLDKINRETHRREPRSLSPQARRLLLDYSWPGNIREMRHRLGCICLLSDELVTAEDVREQLGEPGRPPGPQPPATPPAGPCAENELPHDLAAWLQGWEAYWLTQASRHYPLQRAAARRLGLKTSTYGTKLGKARLAETKK